MNRSLRYFILGVSSALAAVAVYGVLSVGPLSAAPDKSGAGLSLFSEVFDEVRVNYVEPVTDQKLVEGAIKGMLAALDPHSSYMDAKEYGEMQVADPGRIRRPGHAGDDGKRPGQGDLADRRHAGGQGRHQSPAI